MPNGRPKLVEVAAGHRTKAEIEYRKQNEQYLYTGIPYEESEEVKNNAAAHAVFLWIKKVYEQIPFIDGLDEQTINRYCLETAEVQSLQNMIVKMEFDLEECETASDRILLYRSIAGLMTLAHKKKEMLLKLEDRLFLNPAGRIKAIPKQPPKKEELSGIEKLLSSGRPK